MAIEVDPSHRYIIEFCHEEKIVPIDIRQYLLNAYRNQTMDISTIR